MRRSILLATIAGLTAMFAAAAHGEEEKPLPPDLPPAGFAAPEPAPPPAEPPPLRPGGRRQGFGGPHRGEEPPRWGMNDPRRGGEGPGPDGGTVLQPEEVDAFLAFCRQHFPPLHDDLVRARQADPRAFRQMLRQVGPPMTRLMRLWREDPQEADHIIRMQKIEMGLREQRQRYHRAGPPEREAARQEIRRLLQERFDLRLARLKNDVEQLRQRLDEQTRRLTEQEQRKAQIVDEEFARFFEPPPGTEKGPRWRRPTGPASQPETDGVSEIRQ